MSDMSEEKFIPKAVFESAIDFLKKSGVAPKLCEECGAKFWAFYPNAQNPEKVLCADCDPDNAEKNNITMETQGEAPKAKKKKR